MLSQRVSAFLEREGLLVQDIENTYLQLEPPDESAMNDLLGHSITYRIAVGPQAGRKAFTLQTVPAREPDHDQPNLAKTAGFSVHAGVAAKAKAHQRRKLERPCRYVVRPLRVGSRQWASPRGTSAVPPIADTGRGTGTVHSHFTLLGEARLSLLTYLGESGAAWLNKILGTVHAYPTLAEATKFAAGEWKHAHVPTGVLAWVERYHAWRRGNN